MATLKNHPGQWLRDDAAASLARFEARYGIISVNSAGRTVAEQQALIDRWNRGGTYNRPPYLYEPKRPASASSHVYDGGIAIDTNHQSLMLSKGREYGWYRRYAWDYPHFEYDPKLDQHRNQAAGGNASKPSKEDEMTPEQSAKLDAVYAALFGARNLTEKADPITWVNISGDAQKSNYGVLPIVIHNQNLLADLIGRVGKLEAE